jgi:hypothetical protein
MFRVVWICGLRAIFYLPRRTVVISLPYCSLPLVVVVVVVAGGQREVCYNLEVLAHREACMDQLVHTRNKVISS